MLRQKMVAVLSILLALSITACGGVGSHTEKNQTTTEQNKDDENKESVSEEEHSADSSDVTPEKETENDIKESLTVLTHKGKSIDIASCTAEEFRNFFAEDGVTIDYEIKEPLKAYSRRDYRIYFKNEKIGYIYLRNLTDDEIDIREAAIEGISLSGELAGSCQIDSPHQAYIMVEKNGHILEDIIREEAINSSAKGDDFFTNYSSYSFEYYQSIDDYIGKKYSRYGPTQLAEIRESVEAEFHNKNSIYRIIMAFTMMEERGLYRVEWDFRDNSLVSLDINSYDMEHYGESGQWPYREELPLFQYEERSMNLAADPVEFEIPAESELDYIVENPDLRPQIAETMAAPY